MRQCSRFSPRPRLHFGLALPTGYESEGEYLDVDLVGDPQIPLESLAAVLTDCLPQGLAVQAVVPVKPGTDSLQQAVTSSSWEIELDGVDPSDVEHAVAQALATEALPITVERKGSETVLDARPAILALEARGSGLVAELATQPRSLRPAELLRAIDPTWTARSVLRTNQWTSVDGARCEPIPFGYLGARGATSTPHAEARVR